MQVRSFWCHREPISKYDNHTSNKTEYSRYLKAEVHLKITDISTQSSNFEGKIGFYIPEITLTTEFTGSNFSLPTFSIGSKRDFQVANLPLAPVNFEPVMAHVVQPVHSVHFEIRSFL